VFINEIEKKEGDEEKRKKENEETKHHALRSGDKEMPRYNKKQKGNGLPQKDL